MSIKFYVRKLNAQELGYRGGRVRQAGRYILVSKKKELMGFFPEFRKDIVEPSISLGLVNSTTNKLVYCEYVWHNGSSHKGQDQRIYLGQDIDPANSFFNLNDYAIFYKHTYEDNFIYIVYKFNPADKEYKLLDELTGGDSHTFFESIPFIDVKNIKFKEYIISEQTLNKHRRKGEDNDESTCDSQTEFKNFVRVAYENTCAITSSNYNIPSTSYTHLHACHFMPDYCNGPLRPDNGILLGRDLHWAFDYGCFTLSDNLEVKVSPEMKKTNLIELEGKKILIPKIDIYKPNLKYVKFHQEQIFGRLEPIKTLKF